MHILPIPTAAIHTSDDIAQILLQNTELEDNDIVVISSKVIATAEGAAIDLETINISDAAKEWSRKMAERSFGGKDDDPAFRQAVLDETKRMNGEVVSYCHNAMITELRPDGMEEGVILAVNAGLDQSNTERGTAIGWPHNPVASLKKIRDDLVKQSGKTIAVIMSDSCCMPRRLGVIAFALCACGIDPHHSHIGDGDIHGNTMVMTQEAVADQLAIAANAVMGNAAQKIPAAIVRGHNIELTEYAGWVPGIAPEEDLFRGIV